ncbi:hypothetical protein SAMN05421827_10393 [Pedobacter terrae]|uniref:Uncharacterized protein n=1 Tax=Pedobacter terrae TaxID=405671 RepID=A0A1G7R7T3_9SPHI|nr:hypothetical protein [Pedobacter terrae]SDG06229.1 hypothetical protein SAMN05421827_10393 [Pedobacter terrae]
MKNLFQKTILLSSILTASYFSSQAQVGTEITLANNDVNYSGKISTDKTNQDWLASTWNKGAVKLSNDSIYRNLDLIYDIANNRPIFKSENDKPQVFKLGVKEFSINLPTETGRSNVKKFKNGFPSIAGGDASTFYEVLSDGNATLLKKTQIKIIDERPAGSIYSVKQKQKFYTYFIFLENNKKIIEVKKDKKQLLSILEQSKQQKLNSYISENNLNLKKDDELSKLFDYYNTL